MISKRLTAVSIASIHPQRIFFKSFQLKLSNYYCNILTIHVRHSTLHVFPRNFISNSLSRKSYFKSTAEECKGSTQIRNSATENDTEISIDSGQQATTAMVFPIIMHENENIPNIEVDQKTEENIKITTSSIVMNPSSSSSNMGKDSDMGLYVQMQNFVQNHINHCLHFSNGLAIISMFCTDMLYLRGFLASAHLCIIVYYSALNPPMKLPRIWAVIFFFGQLLMIFKLLMENRTVELTDTEHDIYCQSFREHGFTPLQFQKMIKCANFCKVRRGDIVCREGDLQKNTMYLYEGSMEVQQNNIIVGGILNQGFIGNLLRNKNAIKNNLETEEEKQSESNVAEVQNSNENIIDSKTASNGRKIKIDDSTENIALVHVEDGQDKEVWKATLLALHPSKLLVWDRDELLSLLESNVSLMNAARSAMTADLQKRLRMNQKFSSLQRYKDMLSIVVYDNSIVAEEKIRLNQFRKENNISQIEHKRILQNLGWTIVEYDAGQKRAEYLLEKIRNLTRFYITRTYKLPT